MKFTLSIQTDNAAFHGEDCPDAEHGCPEREYEIGCLLRELASQAEGGLSNYANRTALGVSGWIDDHNGNQIGYWELGE